ncbi:cardiomyopathy-associated protein 5 [Spea bombifrons]|uniref:cardiomyopathy-associated protein 5 n=1 Tax=Spea bombifrons TaxID=233779 RepID=UPI00234904C3|nr:cardiomyopathy-associated protein 5 [Spea bombifrons]
METLCPADCDRASEISFCLEDEVPPETVLNAEETEELKQSLKDIVHTEDVKPKLQCLMSNPCFSMVTVQCEDSGIHWETSSSRCSTPWASEASTTSDVYSMESSSVGTPPGKVIFIMDEGKLRRKRVRPSSQYSRHASHEKKSLSHQKESAENMGNAVKEAIEKARSQSSILTERTNNINGSNDVTKILELKSISIPENQAKKKKSIDSGVHVLNTVSEQADEVKEESIQDVSEKSSTKASLDDAKSTPDIAKIKQSFPKDSVDPLVKTDFQQMGSTLDSSVNGLSKKSAAVSSALISQAENHLSTEKVDRVSKQENYNLSHAPSVKKQEDIEFNTLQRPYTEPEESIINSSLSGDRLDQKEPLLLNPSFIQSLTEPPSSLPLYFTDTDEIPSPKISTIEMLVERLLNETTKSALEQSSRQNLSDEPKEEQTQETMESKMEPSYRYVQGNISSVVGDNERQRERFTMAPIEEVFGIPPSSSLTAATNNSEVKQSSGSLRTMDLATENTPKLLYPEEQTVTHQTNYLDTKEPPDTQSDVFSIVSEGSEILNIIAPQLISSVDQEASDEMQDRLEYLNETPLLTPKLLHQEENALVKPNISVDTHLEANQDVRPQLKKSESGEEHAKKADSANVRQYNASKSITDIDYFEKFTLIDDKMPVGSEVAKATYVEKAKLKSELSGNFKDSLEDEYYMLENLDESFYGVMKSDDTMTDYGSFKFERSTANKEDTQTHESDVKPTGTSLFNPEEEVLCKSLFFPTSYPINPELLQEPPALAFLYEDLYEKATKDENEPSDAESTASGATFHSRISDDDGTGIYFEKYILKDEIPIDKAKPKEVKDLVDGLESDSPIISQTKPQTNSLRREQVFGDSCNNEIPKEITEGNNGIYEVLSHGPSKETSREGNKEYFKPKPNEKEQATLSGSKITDMLEEHLREEVQTSNKAKEQSEGGDIRPVNAEGTQRAYEKETQCLKNEFTAESLDYVVISQEDLQDEIPHVQVASEDRDSLGHDFDSGFDLVIDADQEMQLDHGDSGFEIIENEKSPGELTEPSLMDGKGTQIDTYCYTCKVPIMAIDKIFGDHKDHDVTTIDNAINEMTEVLEDLLEKLQESSLKTEDFVSKVEALFNDVETNCTETEKVLEEQNEKMVQKVISQHAAQRESFEEMKKVKMEFLHDQMISFQQKVDTAKEILERAAKDMEELDPVVFLSLHDEVNTRLLTAMESMASLDEIPNASALFEKCSVSSTREDQKILKSLPVPQTPKLKAQEPNSATSTSITVYWAMSEGDVIDCFQVYCMEEPQGNREEHALLEEYRVTVKESFCILEDLEPDKCYNVWVMAVNYTGCSFPSEKTTFKTAPSSPIIKAEECTVCWDTAVIRWSAAHPESTDSFTLEWCKQYSSEGEGLRSVAGIKDQQLKVTLQPNENYFFYVRAVNAFGSSEQSEAALISTKGTRFHLLRDTAHPALDLSPDGTVISISEQNEITGIPLVLGELLPAKGRHYWEMMVSGCRAYSVGATFQPSKEDYPFVQESTTWCMQCCSTSTSFSYKFLHNEVLSEVHLTEPPVRVGILLEYTIGRLSFYNVQKGNLLFSFRHRFSEAAHPTFVLEAHGELHLHTGIELPRFAKHS